MAKKATLPSPRVNRSKQQSSEENLNKASGAVGKTKSSEAAQAAKATATVKRNTELQGLPELLAKDKNKKIKHEWPGARKAFPAQKKFWYVDLFFPYADGGPLFIDQIKTDAHKKELDSKLKTMKKLGHRYIQLTSGMDLTAAQEQLA